MDFLTEALKPIPVVVWGGPALERCGVQAFIYGYIFIVNECDRDLAAAKLLDAGCIRADWSWGSTDPATLQTLDDNAQRIHKKSIPEYEDIDNNSIRFVFPPESVGIMNEPIALVLPSFVGLGPPWTAALGSGEPAQSETQNDESSTRLHEWPQAEVLVQEEDMLQEDTPQEVTSSAVTPQENIPQEDKPQEDTPQEDTPQEENIQEDIPQEDKLQEDIPQEDIPQEDKSQEDESHEDRLQEAAPQEDKHQEAATLLEPQTLSEQGLHPDLESLQPTKSQQNSELLQDITNTPDIEELQGGEELQQITVDDSKFTCVDCFLYYPRLPILLETIIRARLRVPEEKVSYWATMLEVWAIPYLWAQTMAPEDVLDGIEDEEVKAWFNKATKRFEGGIDRVTNTKRKGRVASTRPPVDLDTLFD
ncbi:hypothetical protein THAR02_06256 [Trichoderma harzianum]|uniref:Uncharacterized protein n=1 Tax=Trichoderma harzianum TaxID=5544 RepID=A0A0G0A973_TRIHA|nr:hypothetical protein THAR02_06256 [Trichoderma harzianum]